MVTLLTHFHLPPKEWVSEHILHRIPLSSRWQRSRIKNWSCLSICVSVCYLALPQLNGWHTDPEFGTAIYLNDISDGIKGQDHRLKIKGTRLENVIFKFSFSLCIASRWFKIHTFAHGWFFLYLIIYSKLQAFLLTQMEGIRPKTIILVLKAPAMHA